jgi:hypothetical protein
LRFEQENPKMAKTRRKKASGDVKILGGLDAITSLLVKAKKTAKRRLEIRK